MICNIKDLPNPGRKWAVLFQSKSKHGYKYWIGSKHSHSPPGLYSMQIIKNGRLFGSIQCTNTTQAPESFIFSLAPDKQKGAQLCRRYYLVI